MLKTSDILASFDSIISKRDKINSLVSSRIEVFPKDPRNLLCFLKLYKLYSTNNIINVKDNECKEDYDRFKNYFSVLEKLSKNPNSLDDKEKIKIKNLQKFIKSKNSIILNINMQNTYPTHKHALFVCDINDRISFSYKYRGPRSIIYEKFENEFNLLFDFITARNKILKINGIPIDPKVSGGKNSEIIQRNLINEHTIKIDTKRGKEIVCLSPKMIEKRLYDEDMLYIYRNIIKH